MPNRARRPCTTPGCPGLANSGRCDECRTAQRKNYQQRARQHTYYGPAWPARRLDYLTRHPRCVICRRAASIPDHHPVSRRQLVAQGVADPDADEHLRPLCRPCHNTQTAIHQPGGWARDRERP
jgi:5-methylcytosine-specific restriction enzyme A